MQQRLNQLLELWEVQIEALEAALDRITDEKDLDRTEAEACVLAESVRQLRSVLAGREMSVDTVALRQSCF